MKKLKLKAQLERLLKQQQQEEEPPQCLNKCNGRGICLEGRCLCDAGFSGQDCGNAEDPRLTSELPALRSSDLVVENSSSDDEEKESSVSTTVATFGSFFAFVFFFTNIKQANTRIINFE